MMVLIRESKRDELILPYLQILTNKGIQKSFREFKGEMLEKLANQAGMHNLSKSSNYYLAGAVRYYFEGQLTTDGKAAYAEAGDVKQMDNWNVEVCKQLDALVEVLRNAYIDTIGTSFEQPEDFGTMPIKKLLRKYQKKIKAELGVENGEEEEETLNRDTNVGNGYTFDILYSFDDATKYERFTAPGSWCITYGQCHYDGYVRRLGIHYVIFLKNGYEDVPREVGPGYTRQKPHDAYGNSMIAVLQSNSSWEPIYITSRWNHGYGQTSGTEADHAYTTEEFCRITGVSVDDLKRIYEIWKNDVKRARGTSRVDKQTTLAVTRRIKYAQMLMDGGESVDNALKATDIKADKVLLPKKWEGTIEELNKNKAVLACTLEINGNLFYVILDKRKFILQTLCLFPKNITTGDEALFLEENKGAVNDAIVITTSDDYTMFYNTRFHEMLDINGKIKFKRIPSPERWRRVRYDGHFFEIKMGKKDIALISTSTLRPLKLPNGEFWFNDIIYPGERRWESRNAIHSHIIPTEACIMEIIYDESSGEKYFYNTVTNKFIDVDDLTDTNRILDTNFCARGFFATKERGWNSDSNEKIFDYKGEQQSIYGFNVFKTIQQENETNLVGFGYRNPNYRWTTLYCYIYDLANKKFISYGDELIKVSSINCEYLYDGYISFRGGTTRIDYRDIMYSIIYDTKTGQLVKNPSNFPNEYSFFGAEIRPLSEFKGYIESDYERPATFPDEGTPDDAPCVMFKKDNFDLYSYREAGLTSHQAYMKGRKELYEHRMWFADLTKMEEIPNTTVKDDGSLNMQALLRTADDSLDATVIERLKDHLKEQVTTLAESKKIKLTEADIVDMVNNVVKLICENHDK